MSFSTSVACHIEHVIGPWKSSPAKRPGITSHYCARMQNSGDDYRSSRIFNSCPGPEGLGRSNNEKWGSPYSFLSYKHLKGKLRVFLTGKTVAIVTGDVMKITTTYSATIGHLVDIIIVAPTDKDW